MNGKPMLLASPLWKGIHQRKESDYPLDYNWDMTNLICFNIKFLNGSVHLSVSPIISRYFESSLEQNTSKGEKAKRTVDWDLPRCFHFLDL